MAWNPSEKEIQSVLALDGDKRYDYFVKKVADQEQVWSLRHDQGWVLASGDAGRVLIPVWPAEKFALACATGTWEGHAAQAIDLDAWLERWTPGMEKDARLVAVFPSPQDKGIAVEPRQLESDLREELLNYE